MLLAKYDGRCMRTGQRIIKGDTIKLVKGKAVLVSRNSERSELIIIGGRDYIQNQRGRCIDAPCCGCCTL